MESSYKPLCYLLIEKDMNKGNLVKVIDITHNSVARMGKDTYVILIR